MAVSVAMVGERDAVQLGMVSAHGNGARGTSVKGPRRCSVQLRVTLKHCKPVILQIIIINTGPATMTGRTAWGSYDDVLDIHG